MEMGSWVRVRKSHANQEFRLFLVRLTGQLLIGGSQDPSMDLTVC